LIAAATMRVTSMTYAITMRPETNAITMWPETTLDITTYWLVVDGDNVGTIAPLVQLVPAPVAEYWTWRISFPMTDMPDWCRGRAPTLEQAQVEAEQAFTRIRDGLSQTEYDEALWKKDGKVRGLN
jgi:hypothetical protein